MAIYLEASSIRMSWPRPWKVTACSWATLNHCSRSARKCSNAQCCQHTSSPPKRAFFYLSSASSGDAAPTWQSAHDAITKNHRFPALLFHCRQETEKVSSLSGQTQYLQRGQVRRVSTLHGGVQLFLSWDRRLLPPGLKLLRSRLQALDCDVQGAHDVCAATQAGVQQPLQQSLTITGRDKWKSGIDARGKCYSANIAGASASAAAENFTLTHARDKWTSPRSFCKGAVKAQDAAR